MKIPIIINNRDLLTWPKAMIERIKKYDDVGEIIIIDNNSSYKPLLEWYDDYDGIVFLRNKNFGHTAPWDAGIVEDLNSPYYVVTDSDMGLENTPDNTLTYLMGKEKELKLGKIGLGLMWGNVPQASPYFNHMMNYEGPRFNKSRVVSDVHIDCAIDTTFALYSRQEYFIGGGCTKWPYVARHYPWELTKEEYNENNEFKYYIEHASNSSSYKSFLGL